MKTLKAVMLLACVLFVGAMLRMQHATFAERALRAELRRPAERGAELASAPAPGASPFPGVRTALRMSRRDTRGEP